MRHCVSRINIVLTFAAAHFVFVPILQETETEDVGAGLGEVSSGWDVSADRSSVGKLCKTESQNHMSPRYTSNHLITVDDHIRHMDVP